MEKPRLTWKLGLGIALALCLFAAFIYLRYLCGVSSPRVAFYDWKPRVPIGETDRSLIGEAAGKKIYLKFGTFDRLQGVITYRREVTREVLESYRGFEITACYRWEHSMGEDLKKGDDEQIGQAVISSIGRDLDQAVAWGALPAGLHIDYDCPTSKLVVYNAILQRIHAALIEPRRLSLSITSLPTWMRSPFAFKKLLRNVDYHVPLFFGYGVRTQRAELGPIGGEDGFEWDLFLAGLFGKPFFAGLPTYSLVLVYDAQGALLSIESDFPVEELYRQGCLRQNGGGLDAPFGGTRAEFAVVSEGWVAGRVLRSGWKVVSQEVDGQSLRARTRHIRRWGPSVCQGFLFYKLEKEGGSLGLSPRAVLEAAGTEEIQPGIRTEILDLSIDQGVARFKVAMWNDSEFPTRPLKKPAYLQVRWKNGRLLEAAPGGFSAQKWAHGFERKSASSSMQRANVLHLMCRRLAPRSRCESGVIRVERIDDDFALYLFSEVPLSTGAVRQIQHDREVFPNPVEGKIENDGLN